MTDQKHVSLTWTYHCQQSPFLRYILHHQLHLNLNYDKISLD